MTDEIQKTVQENDPPIIFLEPHTEGLDPFEGRSIRPDDIWEGGGVQYVRIPRTLEEFENVLHLIMEKQNENGLPIHSIQIEHVQRSIQSKREYLINIFLQTHH